jgi:nucleoside-diphosphate-sugar epimerase
MKILLLGAGGFVGANLTERLVNDGQHEMTALDIEREKLDETVKKRRDPFHPFRYTCERERTGTSDG